MAELLLKFLGWFFLSFADFAAINDDIVLVRAAVDLDGAEREVVETGDRIASEWQDLRNTEMEVARIIVDPIPLKSRRYIHVPITKGIKQERIVIFHKGRPRAKDPWIDWTQRPAAQAGPDWASLYT